MRCPREVTFLNRFKIACTYDKTPGFRKSAPYLASFDEKKSRVREGVHTEIIVENLTQKLHYRMAVSQHIPWQCW